MTARYDDGDRGRLGTGAMNAELSPPGVLPVLSKTVCRGNPVTEGVCVKLAVCDRVRGTVTVGLADCDAVPVRVSPVEMVCDRVCEREGVGVSERDPVVVGVCVGERPCDGVPVRVMSVEMVWVGVRACERVPEAVTVGLRVPEGVPDAVVDGVRACDGDPLGVDDGVGPHACLIPRSWTARYGSCWLQLVP